MCLVRLCLNIIHLLLAETGDYLPVSFLLIERLRRERWFS